MTNIFKYKISWDLLFIYEVLTWSCYLTAISIMLMLQYLLSKPVKFIYLHKRNRWPIFQRSIGQLQHHPPIFLSKTLRFYIIRSVYLQVVTPCSILLAISRQLQRYMILLSVAIFKSQHFKKWLPLSWLLNLAPSNHSSNLGENSEACLCSSLDRYKN